MKRERTSRAAGHFSRATRHAPRTTRHAFTLIELLVVVAIIGILVALSASAVIRFIGVQQQNNTDTLLTKIQGELVQQWKLVIDQADKEPIPPAVLAMAGNDAVRARVMYKKLRLKQEFPMNYAEAVTPPSPLPPIKVYQETIWRSQPRGPLPPVNSPQQSAACLLMALTRSRGGRVLNPDDLGASAITDTNGDNIPEIVDAWGQPVMFIRWPYRFPELNPGGLPQPGLQDDVDVTGTLTNRNWLGSAGRVPFERELGYRLPDNTSGPQSYKLSPIIASAGPNRVMGLNLDGSIAGQPVDSNDNIYDYTRK